MSAPTPSTNNNQTATRADELLTVAELAALLKCKESSVYNLTRSRSVRYAHELPVIRAPFGTLLPSRNAWRVLEI
jgi:hypothetical protein